MIVLFFRIKYNSQYKIQIKQLPLKGKQTEVSHRVFNEYDLI